MGYVTTMTVMDHTLHTHVYRCMQTEVVSCQIMKNNLQQTMQELLCTSKTEMTRESEGRSWDETTGNVWYRLVTCDHLLDIESWKHGDPPPGTWYLLHDFHQTPTNSKETYRGDSGHLGPTPRSTSNLGRHLERTMGVAMVGRNVITQIRLNSMDSGSQNSDSLPRRDSNLGPPYHVYNGTRCPPPPKVYHRHRDMVRESTIRVHPFQRYRKVNTKSHSRTLRKYSPNRARRHKTHIEPRHTTVMSDRDPHGRIVETRTISKRGHLNTIGTGVTNSMVSPHRSHKTRSKDDWRHHPIMTSLSLMRKPHRQQPLSMLNLSSTVHDNIQYMSPPKIRSRILQGLRDSMSHMSGDQHLDPRYSGN
jgi:hypothetical protein